MNAASTELTVLPLGETDLAWDTLVAGFTESTACHLLGWRHVMAEALGHEAMNWVAVDREGVPVGLLPLVRVRSRLFGDFLVSMPFLNDGGPLGSTPARQALGLRATEEARASRVDLLELRGRSPVPGDLRRSNRKLTVLMDLGDSPEALWEHGLKAKVRSQIRRPMKEGMTPRFGPDQLDPFYEVFARTMRDLGTPVLPRSFFEAIVRHLSDHVTFCVVEHSGTPVAAGCGFSWNGEFEITWAGALREASRMAPNMLLYWALMEDSCRRGVRTFNFGRCSPDSGTHRFKLQWGGHDVPLPWSQWSPSGVAATPNPDSPKYRLATAAWSRLPMGIANRVGPLLSRLIP
ncbi:MAG TPA: FemAB family XrtA/PEP-CTERM system-associated protein [Longimicrobiales bacterium]|nr:FemAB family XrtA/PEP-CTERM system-associated protein [Longimicrobiales bacterium]